jgi:hypothetical protein
MVHDSPPPCALVSALLLSSVNPSTADLKALPSVPSTTPYTVVLHNRTGERTCGVIDPGIGRAIELTATHAELTLGSLSCTVRSKEWWANGD